METTAGKSFPTNMIGLPDRYAAIGKLITNDLNNYRAAPTFSLFNKGDITRFLSNPYKYEKELRRAVIYLYGASPHFRRIIQYFTCLSDLCYVVSPFGIDPKKTNKNTVNRHYRRVLDLLNSMSIKTQFPKILTVCLREDVFYGTFWVMPNSVTVQQLPSDYCSISSIEGNVFNVSFDFSYFDSHPQQLPFYPEEFSVKYEAYKKARRDRWIELDAPNSFAVKCNADIPTYAMPPLAGILREIYDLEDYKQLRMTQEEIENYALLTMKIPMDNDGNWLIDFNKAEEFWRNLDAVMPSEVGSVLTPMPIDKISFERANAGTTDAVAESEKELFSAAGVSSLLFNNEKASANALLLSIKADQALTYGIVKGIQDVVNRFIQWQSYGRFFHVEFLDVSIYNRKEYGDAMLKAASYGLPTISMYAASQGLGQAELDTMSFLETEVLGLQDMFKPLRNSAQISSSEESGSDVDNENGSTGRPTKDSSELTDSGEQSREDGDDW